MKLKEMKVKTFSLIEEYYPELKGLAEDEDVLNKINGIVNSVQMELMTYRKINTSYDFEIKKEDNKVIYIDNYIDDMYQLNKIVFYKDNVSYDMPNDATIILPSDFVGKFTIYYYKNPTLVQVLFKDETAKQKEDENYEFELDPVLLEIMPYGIAADLLKMDMISGYGRYFYERYLEKRNSIDTRRTTGVIKIEGGYNV